MALGTRVVATDCPGGSREILDAGKYGRLVPVNDAARLAAAILEALRLPKQRSSLRKRAEEFSIDKVAERYLSLFHTFGLEPLP